MNNITNILGLRVPALLDTENGTKKSAASRHSISPAFSNLQWSQKAHWLRP
jgi:hypothetical protein